GRNNQSNNFHVLKFTRTIEASGKICSGKIYEIPIGGGVGCQRHPISKWWRHIRTRLDYICASGISVQRQGQSAISHQFEAGKSWRRQYSHLERGIRNKPFKGIGAT